MLWKDASEAGDNVQHGPQTRSIPPGSGSSAVTPGPALLAHLQLYVAPLWLLLAHGKGTCMSLISVKTFLDNAECDERVPGPPIQQAAGVRN